MNKKAIAAFAAGATLLAGFAMATPAFAEDPKVPRIPNAAVVDSDSAALKALKALLAEKYTAADKALKEKNEAKTPATLVDEDGNLLDRLNYKFDDKGEVVKAADNSKDDAATKANTYLEKLKAYKTALAAVATAEKDVNDNTPAAPKASANVAVAKLKDTEKPLKEAQTKLDEAFGKYDAAYVAYKSAQQDKADAKKALEDYTRNHENEALPTYHAEVASLTKALKVAEEAEKKAKNAYSDAKADFEKAKKAFTDAWDKYNGAYKAALAAKADVSDFKTPESLNHDFNSEYQPGEGFVPGAGASHTGKPGAAKPGQAGQAGKAGQAGANGAAAAGAKTEVENKKDKDKRGNTHTGTGVGVTLTALAATMLAGMGAAVRKARH